MDCLNKKTDCFFHGNFHRFSHVNHGPLWAARSRIEHFEAPGAGNSCGELLRFKTPALLTRFFSPLMNYLLDRETDHDEAVEFSIYDISIYLYILFIHLFIYFSSFLVVETPNFVNFPGPLSTGAFCPPQTWRFRCRLPGAAGCPWPWPRCSRPKSFATWPGRQKPREMVNIPIKNVTGGLFMDHPQMVIWRGFSSVSIRHKFWTWKTTATSALQNPSTMSTSAAWVDPLVFCGLSGVELGFQNTFSWIFYFHSFAVRK